MAPDSRNDPSGNQWGLSPTDLRIMHTLYGDELDLLPGMYAQDLYFDTGAWANTLPSLTFEARRRLVRQLTEAGAHLLAAYCPVLPGVGEANALAEAEQVLAWERMRVAQEEQLREIRRMFGDTDD